MRCSKISWWSPALILELINHSGPKAADNMAHLNITDCRNFTLHFINLDAMALHSSFRLWHFHFEMKSKTYFNLKSWLWTPEHQSSSSFPRWKAFWSLWFRSDLKCCSCSLSPGCIIVSLSSNFRFGPCLVNLHETLKWVLLHNPPTAVVPVACVPF